MSVVVRVNDPFLAKQNKDRFSNYFRGRRFPALLSMIEKIHAEKGRCRIADVGGRQEYWNPVLPTLNKMRVEISVINLEQTQPEASGIFDFAYGNACDLSGYDSNSFDMVHQNSLIEHVGNWEAMKRCANETRRLAPSYYVQTPYYGFPLEPHFRVPFFHWLPEQVRARLVQSFQLGYFHKAKDFHEAMEHVQSAVLLDKRQFQTLFPDAEIRFERVLGLPKSMIATRKS
jgi:hypothetical protein